MPKTEEVSHRDNERRILKGSLAHKKRIDYLKFAIGNAGISGGKTDGRRTLERTREEYLKGMNTVINRVS